MFPRDILLCFLSHILIYSYFSLPWIFVAFGQVFSSCSEWGLLFVAGHCLLQWLLLLWSLNSRVHKLSCSMACGILPHKGSNPSPALEGRFLTTRPPGKSLPYSYRGLRISLIPKEPWRKNDITRKNVAPVKTSKTPRSNLLWIVRIVTRLIFRNKETSNLAKGKSHLPRWRHRVLFWWLLTVENLDLIVCDHLIKSSLTSLKLPLKQKFYLLFCSPF